MCQYRYAMRDVAMANKRITLSVDAEVYEKYKKLCDQMGFIISKQVENFMREKIKQREK